MRHLRRWPLRAAVCRVSAARCDPSHILVAMKLGLERTQGAPHISRSHEVTDIDWGTSVAQQHRAVIERGALSQPIRLAVDLGLIDSDTTVFDYGCGCGEDLHGLANAGISASGWDPRFRPDAAKNAADVVNLGYVINVIPDMAERHNVVLDAWRLTERALIVSVGLDNEHRNLPDGRPHGDGFMTAHGAFQKFYGQDEFRAWLDAVLGIETIALAPGVSVAFKAEKDANEFLIRHERRRRRGSQRQRAD